MFNYIHNRILTRGTASAAFSRCLPIWRKAGGINDFRGIIGQPFYSPSPAKRLGMAYARRHPTSVPVILPYAQDQDTTTAICAIDLLSLFDDGMHHDSLPILRSSSIPLSEPVRAVLIADTTMECGASGRPTPDFQTVGEYFTWQSEGWQFD